MPMIQQVVMFAINSLLAALPPEKIKGFIKAGADMAKARFEATPNKFDDAAIPAIDLVLAALNVPGENGEIDVTAELKKLLKILGDQSKIFIDAGLDWVEIKVTESPTKLDDAAVLPLCRLVRNVLNVPDDDEIN
jgi:hypothetical protein